jgi:hypothetical protein
VSARWRGGPANTIILYIHCHDCLYSLLSKLQLSHPDPGRPANPRVYMVLFAQLLQQLRINNCALPRGSCATQRGHVYTPAPMTGSLGDHLIHQPSANTGRDCPLCQHCCQLHGASPTRTKISVASMQLNVVASCDCRRWATGGDKLFHIAPNSYRITLAIRLRTQACCKHR